MINMANTTQRNYNYNPSLNIPADKIKPVNCLNNKLNRQSKGKAMVHCISALSEANGRCKEQLRINYLKGIIQKKIHNEKYKHLQNISLSGNTHQIAFRQTLVPSQYIQPGRTSNISQNTNANTFRQQTGNQNNSNYQLSSFNVLSSNKGILNNPFGYSGINNNFQNNSYLEKEKNSNIIITNQSQNYNLTYNQQINQVNKSNNMLSQNNTSLQQPTLQRGNTFGAVSPNSNNPFFNQQKPGNIQQQNTGTNSFGQNQTNPFNTLQNNLNSNQNNINSFNHAPNQLQQNQNLITQNQPSSFSQNQNLNSFQNSTPNGMSNQAQLLVNSNIPNKNILSMNQPVQGTFNQQTRQYSMKYPILYKIKQQQLKRFKERNINQSNFNIQSLNKHLKDFEQNKFNIWNSITLNKLQMGPNNEQGRRYITHILKRMTDEKLIDEQILKDSISTLYKFMYGEGVFNQMMNQYKSKSSIKNQNNNNAFFNFMDDQPKNIRLDQILGKSTDQTSHSVRGRFKSLQNFDDKIFTTNKQIRRYNLDNNYVEEQNNQQEKQKSFLVKLIPQKKITSKIKYFIPQLQKVGQLIKQSRQETFKSIMVQHNQLPVIQDFIISPSISQLSKMLKSQIKSVPHVKIQNQWGILQFLSPVSLFKKNLKQCIILKQNQVFINDQEWKIRQCRINFKKFANFGEMTEDQRNDYEFRIQKWCKDQQLQLVQINKIDGRVIIKI